MATRKYKPTSAGRRGMTGHDFSEITTSKPLKKLTEAKRRHGGRNSTGSISAWQRGGGHKKRYRLIDFRRDKRGVPAKVASIEYDPNRSARIARLNYADGEKRYILAPLGLELGARLLAGDKVDILVGNALPLRNIPLGTTLHNVELKPGRGGQIARSAGTGVQLLAKEGEYAQLRLPSGEVRKIHLECYASIGMIGNIDHENVSIGKAGRNRWLGWRSHVRGVAMNPVDHPLGGGEGKSSGGRHPCTPWGKPTKGFKTRRNKRTTKMIVRRRGVKG